ncbi:hypothetical protein [Herbaspirillum sp. VT-16-41]|uniref:hypothetical protein n=1 Tax=Herbaspirillum sp. VT-16-41 TaxID=1953765 RepID=UPI0011159D91|nr:hypothetical protein [Herbaspirillum sp. VT-16-41]
MSSDLAQSPLSQALLVQIHNSPVAAIRAAGIALLGKQSPELVLLQLPQLIDLLQCGEAEERQACYTLLGQLAGQHAAEVFAGL